MAALKLSSGFSIQARATSCCLLAGRASQWLRGSIPQASFWRNSFVSFELFLFQPPSPPAFVLHLSSVRFFSLGMFSFAGAAWCLYRELKNLRYFQVLSRLCLTFPFAFEHPWCFLHLWLSFCLLHPVGLYCGLHFFLAPFFLNFGMWQSPVYWHNTFRRHQWLACFLFGGLCFVFTVAHGLSSCGAQALQLQHAGLVAL